MQGLEGSLSPNAQPKGKLCPGLHSHCHTRLCIQSTHRDIHSRTHTEVHLHTLTYIHTHQYHHHTNAPNIPKQVCKPAFPEVPVAMGSQSLLGPWTMDTSSFTSRNYLAPRGLVLVRKSRLVQDHWQIQSRARTTSPSAWEPEHTGAPSPPHQPLASGSPWQVLDPPIPESSGSGPHPKACPSLLISALP